VVFVRDLSSGFSVSIDENCLELLTTKESLEKLVFSTKPEKTSWNKAFSEVTELPVANNGNVPPSPASERRSFFRSRSFTPGPDGSPVPNLTRNTTLSYSSDSVPTEKKTPVRATASTDNITVPSSPSSLRKSPTVATRNSPSASRKASFGSLGRPPLLNDAINESEIAKNSQINTVCVRFRPSAKDKLFCASCGQMRESHLKPSELKQILEQQPQTQATTRGSTIENLALIKELTQRLDSEIEIRKLVEKELDDTKAKCEQLETRISVLEGFHNYAPIERVPSIRGNQQEEEEDKNLLQATIQTMKEEVTSMVQLLQTENETLRKLVENLGQQVSNKCST
jgi:hypothetical protein